MTRDRLHSLLTHLTTETLGQTKDITFTIHTVEASDRDDNWLESDIDLTVPPPRKEQFRNSLRDLADTLAEDAVWSFDPEADVEESDDGWRLTITVRL